VLRATRCTDSQSTSPEKNMHMVMGKPDDRLESHVQDLEALKYDILGMDNQHEETTTYGQDVKLTMILGTLSHSWFVTIGRACSDAVITL
jgi:hypothetical protein